MVNRSIFIFYTYKKLTITLCQLFKPNADKKHKAYFVRYLYLKIILKFHNNAT